MKKVVLLLLLVAVALTSTAIKAGGWTNVNAEGLLSLQDDEIFNRAEKLARDAYAAEHNGELGQIISVSSQVVSGVNYKMVFETDAGQRYEVTVYCQPWTETYEILGMKPYTEAQ